jgi:hypothetical protein
VVVDHRVKSWERWTTGNSVWWSTGKSGGNGGQRGEASPFKGGAEDTGTARIEGRRRMSCITAWPSGSARCLRNSRRNEDDDRQPLTKLTTAASHFQAGPGHQGSWRTLLTFPIGSCRVGAGVGVPANFLGSRPRRHDFRAIVRRFFLASSPKSMPGCI